MGAEAGGGDDGAVASGDRPAATARRAITASSASAAIRNRALTQIAAVLSQSAMFTLAPALLPGGKQAPGQRAQVTAT